MGSNASVQIVPRNENDIYVIAQKASRGDREALGLLCEKIAKGVLFQLITLLGNRANAEDVSQEVLIRVCSNIHTLRDIKTFRGWLARIIVNEKNRFLQKQLRHEPALNVDDHTEDLQESSDDLIPHNYVENTETHSIVMNIVQKLPDKQKEAVMLHYYSELSVTEVAKTMQVTTQTVSKNLSLARDKIKQGLGRVFP
ncbi:MAG: RNA polymerase sigma factor [Defluviitaleaceae bacterium]|nr:RNA polymerase sigma factor [Defluviitaleaceae bacterium]